MCDQEASTNVPAAQTDATELELELAGDVQWKTIQKNCFTRWTNEQLKNVKKNVVDLEKDLSDGLRLIALVEVLSGKKFPKFNKSPNNKTEELDNVTTALKFLREHEGIKIVNIDSSDIVDHNLKLILGLIWTLIQHYSISKLPVWEDEKGRPQRQGQTPKQWLLGWIQGKLPDKQVGNFTTDWNDGKAIGALVDGVAPGLCPDWESWNPENNVENATKAIKAAEQWLGVPQLIQPAEMCSPNVDELSMMTYLSQFPSAKVKSGVPLCPVLDSKSLRRHMERQRFKLIELIESDFGFLDHLLSNGVILYCEIEKIRSAQTRYEKIGKLLDYIFSNNKHKDLMTALSKYCHSHVANWITGNGGYREEFGLNWPLSAKEHQFLDVNQTHLIEMIEPPEVVFKLYSKRAINNWQREFIASKAVIYEQNVALFDILRRSSLNVYVKLIKCLEETKQTHISSVLKADGAIVAVHATLESDDLDEAETQIVEELTATIRRKTTLTEEAKRLFKKLKLNVMAVKRGGSIVLYTGCCKEEDLNHLCQVGENENTKETLEILFASCVPNQTIKVLDVKASEEDLMKAKQTFAQKQTNEEIREKGKDKDIQIVERIDQPETEKETANTLDPKKQSNEEIGENVLDMERIEQSETDKTTANTLDPKPTKCVESCVFVIGFSLGDTLWPPSKDVVKINLNQSAEVSYKTPIPAQMIIESAAAVYRDSIFVTGTGKHSTEIWRFDTSFSTWAKRAPLAQRRRRHSVAFVNHMLYMCGGYVDEFSGLGWSGVLRDIEVYDVHKNSCQSVGKLALAVESSGNCVPYKSKLYIFGGTGAQGNVQVYDTKSNTGTLISPPVPLGVKYRRAVLWKSTVILVGAQGSFTYNFETEGWGVRNKFQTGDVYFGLAICDDLLFVIGGGHYQNNGWICRNDVRSVPVASILNDEPIEWKLHAKMPKPSLVYAFGQMGLEA